MKNQIIIIGNGLAGLSAAITAAENGQHVVLIAISSPDRTQSVLAAGGMNAALNTKGEDDSVLEHCADTLHAGCDIADPIAVQNMTKCAPEIVKWLEDIGALFSRDNNFSYNEKGNVDVRNFGGQKKKRTVYAKAGIGRQLICSLSQEMRKYKAKGMIDVMEFCYFLEPVIVENHICGCTIYDERKKCVQAVLGKAVIAASGGMSFLFPYTTGSTQSDGSVTAALYHAGAELSNCEMIQYHPTTVQAQSKRMLISEAARGEGGRLLVMKDGKPWYFMEDWYPEGGNLMPRDIVSKSIYRVCHELGLGINGRDAVYLDLTHLSNKKRKDSLKEVDDLCQKYLGLDISKEMIPVYPGVHYFMGGLHVNRKHQTNILGLYAAGECCSQYHGANRLGGNSTLGAIYGGKIAGQNAANEKVLDEKYNKKISDEIDKLTNFQRGCTYENDIYSIADILASSDIKARIQELMQNSMGIVRNEQELQKAASKCSELISQTNGKNYELALLALALIESAKIRKETRGAHIRSDYPQRNDSYNGVTKVSYSKMKGMQICIE